MINVQIQKKNLTHLQPVLLFKDSSVMVSDRSRRSSKRDRIFLSIADRSKFDHRSSPRAGANPLSQPGASAAAGPFSTQPPGPRSVGCFSALLARPVPLHFCADCRIAIQARGKNGAGWALCSRLEKQPTDLRRNQRDLGDGALGCDNP
jgi:hypothetical protein